MSVGGLDTSDSILILIVPLSSISFSLDHFADQHHSGCQAIPSIQSVTTGRVQRNVVRKEELLPYLKDITVLVKLLPFQSKLERFLTFTNECGMYWIYLEQIVSDLKDEQIAMFTQPPKGIKYEQLRRMFPHLLFLKQYDYSQYFYSNDNNNNEFHIMSMKKLLGKFRSFMRFISTLWSILTLKLVQRYQKLIVKEYIELFWKQYFYPILYKKEDDFTLSFPSPLAIPNVGDDQFAASFTLPNEDEAESSVTDESLPGVPQLTTSTTEQSNGGISKEVVAEMSKASSTMKQELHDLKMSYYNENKKRSFDEVIRQYRDPDNVLYSNNIVFNHWFNYDHVFDLSSSEDTVGSGKNVVNLPIKGSDIEPHDNHSRCRVPIRQFGNDQEAKVEAERFIHRIGFYHPPPPLLPLTEEALRIKKATTMSVKKGDYKYTILR